MTGQKTVCVILTIQSSTLYPSGLVGYAHTRERSKLNPFSKRISNLPIHDININFKTMKVFHRYKQRLDFGPL